MHIVEIQAQHTLKDEKTKTTRKYFTNKENGNGLNEATKIKNVVICFDFLYTSCKLYTYIIYYIIYVL